MKEYAFGIDLGGTTAKVGLFTTAGDLLEKWEVATDTSNAGEHILENLASAIRGKMDEKHLTTEQVEGVGIGVPGPILDSRIVPIVCANLGGWGKRNVSEELGGLLGGMKVLVGNDANVAALGEIWMGAAKGCRSAVYITVGTGIGGGVVVDGKTVHGLLHPEVGHMLLRPHPDDPIPHGVCPYHDGCLEGLAAGPAIGARVQGDARNLPDDHPAFRIEAHYLAQMCQNLIVTVSPEKIILGGGVMQRESLFPLVRQETLRLLGGYVQSDRLLNHTDEYIVPPALFPVSGLWGSYLLGKKALENA